MKYQLSLLFAIMFSMASAQAVRDSSFTIPDTLDLALMTDSTRFKPVLAAGNPYKYYLEIRDRWGEVMFVTDIYQQGWNGKLRNRGSVCAEGAYMWMLSFIEMKDTTHRVAKGYVNLINTDQRVNVIALDTIACHPEVYVPNAFTPNSDGRNDYLIPRSGCPPASWEFTIYDRWGNTLFKTTDPNVGWDGNFNGYPVAMDVYVYRVKCRFYNGDQLHDFTGHVSVLR